MPKRAVALRWPTRKTSGTHADLERRKKPPANASHPFTPKYRVQGENRSKLTMGVVLPQLIAARFRQASGTVTVTVAADQTTSPAFRQ